MRVAIVSTELSPFIGGGIAACVRGTAQALAGAGHHVDVFTRQAFRERARDLVGDSPVFRHPLVQWHWVPEPPDDAPDWHSEMSQRLNAALAVAYRHAAPDLVEIQDYLGLGAHIAVDRAAGTLRDALVVNRLHTSLEQLASLDEQPPNLPLSELERVSLLASDVIVAPSEAVIDFYRSFYGDLALPPSVVVWPGFLRDNAPSPLPARRPTTDLELLLLGRYQRVKGTDRLVRAVLDLPDLPIRLTLVGADTPTGPDGRSMRELVEEISAADPRITTSGPIARAEISTALARTDVVVVSSLWETWGNVALEALAAARPLLVTPCASLPLIAGHGRFGIVAAGDEQHDLERALEQAVAERERLESLAGDPALAAYLDELTDSERVAAGYEALLAHAARAPRRGFDEWRAMAETPGRGAG